MKKSKISKLIQVIKSFFFRTNGILLLNRPEFQNEVNDYYNEVARDLEMKRPYEDKKNMKADAANLKGDIKKAVAAYHSELVNG